MAKNNKLAMIEKCLPDKLTEIKSNLKSIEIVPIEIPTRKNKYTSIVTCKMISDDDRIFSGFGCADMSDVHVKTIQSVVQYAALNAVDLVTSLFSSTNLNNKIIDI